MDELTAEWCRMKAAEWGAMRPNPSESMGDARKTAAALTIAARVLDDGAVERLAQAFYISWSGHPDYVPWVPGGNSFKQDDARAHARAVLAYLKGEK